jgi:hypothetical protein
MSTLLLLASGDGPSQGKVLAVYVGIAAAVVLIAFSVAWIGMRLDAHVHGTSKH